MVGASSRAGATVSLDGDRALVGAYNDDGLAAEAGSAFVFVRSATSWTEEQKLVGSTTSLGDHFGGSVSLSGDWALIGVQAAGSAFLFLRTASTWAEVQKQVPGDIPASSGFGAKVSLDGDRALIGARDDSPGSA